jgi:hypothetical protein
MAAKYGRRYVEPAKPWDPDLGPLQALPGIWKSREQGWNMIALPFATNGPPFRVLMNQYRETLTFSLVDKNVPNRGIKRGAGGTEEGDQFLVTLDYQQSIDQIEVDDDPRSDDEVRGPACDPDCKPDDRNCLAIHHEPGLWLHMRDERTNDLDIARLATIPHGNSVLALGQSASVTGAPTIPPISGLPLGVPQDLESRYMAPYRKFEEEPFKGTAKDVPGFPGFFPSDMNAILRFANNGVDIDKTTVLEVDSSVEDAGVVNIPFIERQADAASMKSTFWIQELKAKDKNNKPKLRLQYSQIVILDFLPRADGHPGRIRWPHISINTLEKVSDDPTAIV